MTIDDIWITPFHNKGSQITSITENELNPADYVELIHSHSEIDASKFINIFTEQGNIYISANKEIILEYYRKLFPQYAHFRDGKSAMYVSGHPLCRYAEKDSPVYCITLYGEGAVELQASIIIKAPIEGVVISWYYDPRYGDDWDTHDHLLQITPINLVKKSELHHFQTKFSSECKVSFIGYKYYTHFYKDIIENHNEFGSVSITWLVKNGAHVSEQQTIAILECNRQYNNKYTFSIKSFCEGIIFIDLKGCIFGRNCYDFPGPAFYSIYKGYSAVIENRFHNYSEKRSDPDILDCYHVKPWIVNGRYFYNEDGEEIDRYKAFEMCSSSGVSLFISLIVEYNNPMIVFSTDDTKLNFKAGDVISLFMKKDLIDDGTILYFKLEKEYYSGSFHNLYNLSFSSTLYENDLDALIKYNCYSWKYISSDRTKVQIGGNYNNWCPQEYAPESFRNYARKFKLQIKHVDEIILRERYLLNRDKENECRIGLLRNKDNAKYRISSINYEIAQILQKDREKMELVCLKEYPSKDIALEIENTLREAFFTTCEENTWKSLCVADLKVIKTILDGYVNSSWLRENPYI